MSLSDTESNISSAEKVTPSSPRKKVTKMEPLEIDSMTPPPQELTHFWPVDTGDDSEAAATQRSPFKFVTPEREGRTLHRPVPLRRTSKVLPPVFRRATDHCDSVDLKKRMSVSVIAVEPDDTKPAHRRTITETVTTKTTIFYNYEFERIPSRDVYKKTSNKTDVVYTFNSDN